MSTRDLPTVDTGRPRAACSVTVGVDRLGSVSLRLPRGEPPRRRPDPGNSFPRGDGIPPTGRPYQDAARGRRSAGQPRYAATRRDNLLDSDANASTPSGEPWLAKNLPCGFPRLAQEGASRSKLHPIGCWGYRTRCPDRPRAGGRVAVIPGCAAG